MKLNKKQLQQDQEALMDEILLLADKTQTQIAHLIDVSTKNIEDAIKKIYFNYRNRYNLTDAEAIRYLKRKLTAADVINLVGLGYLDQADAASATNQINRLMVLKRYIRKQTNTIKQFQTTNFERLLVNVTTLAYNKTIFNISKNVGFVIDFHKMPQKKMNKLLHHNWLDSNFYKRIQNNCGKFQTKVEAVLTDGILRGKSVDYMSEELTKISHYGKTASEQLIRTEASHFNNQAELEAYQELEIEQYVFLATLDSRTSNICRDLDGKIFPVSKSQEGVNFPPMHPRCRSTTMIYYSQDVLTNLKRRAKMKDGKKIVLNKFTTYREWEKMMIV